VFCAFYIKSPMPANKPSANHIGNKTQNKTIVSPKVKIKTSTAS